MRAEILHVPLVDPSHIVFAFVGARGTAGVGSEENLSWSRMDGMCGALEGDT